MVKNPSRARRRQNLGYLAGAAFGFTFVVIFSLPGVERFHARGPMNPGHEAIECRSCHQPAPGSVRQQIQANVRYTLGLRESAVDFGYRDVSNEVCLGCHDRPNDRHPVFRFFEPRFKEARQSIQPQYCTSCHREHSGKRVTIEEPTYCSNCHQDTRLKNDPITVSHQELIAAERWQSCLGCHDFHGNHVMETNEVMERVIAQHLILDYFNGGPSPYPDTKYYEARQESR